jgi:hypothetical protein
VNPARRIAPRVSAAVLLAAATACGEPLGDDYLPDGSSEAGGEASSGDVCARWRAEYPARSATVWTPGVSTCDPGTAHPDAIEDAVRRTNLFRGLAGLPPVVENAEFSRKAQLCAVLQAAMGDLDHTPPASAPCYSADGAEAAGSSNLAYGISNIADAVDLYLSDTGVRSLGHRRWILHPPYDRAGFGFARGYSCQWVFGWGSDPGVAFVAWPAAGPFPIQALGGPWSIGASGVRFAGATVSVTRVSDGASLTVTDVYVPDSGYGLETLAWTVGGTSGPGAYRVRIEGTARTFDYTVELVDCR